MTSIILEKLKEETDQRSAANEFTKKELDLYAAFVWRNEKKTSAPAKFSRDLSSTLTESEIDELDLKLSMKVRLKLCSSEREKVIKEITDIEKKAEKDIETLKAVLEECRLRIVETKKSVYDLRRDIMFGKYTKLDALGTIVTGGKNNADKLKTYTEEKLKAKRGVVKKYKAKNTSLTKKITKLQENLKAKAEEDGDSLHSVDLDQLKIQNTQFNQKILEKNKELLKLKMVTGKMVQVLNTAKHELAEEMRRSTQSVEALRDMAQIVKTLKENLSQNQNMKVKKRSAALGNEVSVMDMVNLQAKEEQFLHQLSQKERTFT